MKKYRFQIFFLSQYTVKEKEGRDRKLVRDITENTL